MTEAGPADMDMAGKRFVFLSHFYHNLHRFRLPVMQRLVGLGAQVFAVAPPTDRGELFGEHDIEYVPFDISGTSIDPIGDVRTMRRLTDLLRTLRPDVLQTFAPKSNLIGAWAGRRAGTPCTISTVTGLGSLYVGDSLAGKAVARSADLVTRQVFRHVSAVVFQNPDDRDEFLSRGLCDAGQANLVLSSGVDVDEFSPRAVDPACLSQLREEWGIEPSDTVVTMIARLMPSKGVHEYLAAARALGDRARFVLVGKPAFGNRSSITTEQLAAWQASGEIIAPGLQRNIREWLALSDVYVLPSYYREGVPRANLEAMAMRLPIVTTRMPGCKETVVEGENGFLVPPRDSAALTEAVRQLVADAELRQRMGVRSRELVEHRFSITSVVDEYLTLYRRVLQ